MLINNWLHPIGQQDGDLSAVWWMMSKWLGAATGRLTASDDKKNRCRFVCIDKLKSLGMSAVLSEGLLCIAASDDATYLSLLCKLVDIHIDELNAVLDDRWLTD